jgi:hypothetical protein
MFTTSPVIDVYRVGSASQGLDPLLINDLCFSSAVLTLLELPTKDSSLYCFSTVLFNLGEPFVISDTSVQILILT